MGSDLCIRELPQHERRSLSSYFRAAGVVSNIAGGRGTLVVPYNYVFVSAKLSPAGGLFRSIPPGTEPVDGEIGVWIWLSFRHRKTGQGLH